MVFTGALFRESGCSGRSALRNHGADLLLLLKEELVGKTPYYAGIDRIRFKNKVYPGDTLEISSYITRQKGPFYFTRCEVQVNGRVCASGDLSFALVEGR